MANEVLGSRLKGIRNGLMAAHEGGSGLSNASKGNEREAFVDLFLSAAFPTPYRFGTGDIVGHEPDARSGQIDIVIEFPFVPSLPQVPGSRVRIYTAEGVGAAIEVKSGLSSQWGQVKSTWDQLKPIVRHMGSLRPGSNPEQEVDEGVPFYAVGFGGWTRTEKVLEKVKELGISGALVIDSGIFVGQPLNPKHHEPMVGRGEWALWAMMVHVGRHLRRFRFCLPDVRPYAGQRIWQKDLRDRDDPQVKTPSGPNPETG